MFVVEYANEGAKQGWLGLLSAKPNECTQAMSILSSFPHVPTVRVFPLAGQRWRNVSFQGRQYDQWAYLVSNEWQIWYVFDEDPPKSGSGVVWIVSVVPHDFRGGSV